MQHVTISTPSDALPVAGIPPTDVRAVLADNLVRARLLVRGIDEATAAEITTAAFWRCHAPIEQLRNPFHTKTQATVSRETAFAERFGAAAGSLGLDAACDALGRFYAAMLPAGLRATHGIYYTPPPLAHLLLYRAAEAGTDWATARVLDPACGAGAILLRALRRMLDARGKEDPKKTLAHVRDHLRGTDLDPVAAWLCQVMMDAALLPWMTRCGCSAPRLIDVGDSLGTSTDAVYDLIIGNPPYGKVKLSSDRKTRYACSVHGRASLYGLFFYRAVEVVRPGGVIAFLTPTTFLGGAYSCKLRGLLATQAPPLSLDFVLERAGVYDAVVQETVISTWCRGMQPGPIKISEVQMHGDGLTVRPVCDTRLPDALSAPWPLPRRVNQACVAPALQDMTDRLKDWGYRVRTGPTDASRLKDRLASKRSTHRVPLIWADMIDGKEGLLWPHSHRGRSAWINPMA